MRHVALALGVIALFSNAPADAGEVTRPPEDFVVVKQLRVATLPNSCDGACAEAAAAERDKLGPLPLWPLYRASPTEAKARYDQLVRQTGKNSTAAGLTLTREQAVDAWALSFPKGAYNPNDLADVFAKYWIFSWVCAGIDPDEVTEKATAGVRAQAHEILAADPVFSKLSEAQRQVAAETIMRIQGTLYLTIGLVAKEQQKKGKRAGPLIVQFMDKARTLFESGYGLDLRELALTDDEGFAVLLK